MGRSRLRQGVHHVIASALGSRSVREVHVRSGPLAGRRLAVDLLGERWYWTGSFEYDAQRALAAVIAPGSSVYDLGAHVGFMASLAQRLAGPDGFVLAVEANPSLLPRLQRNLALGDGATTEVVGAAVGSVVGETRVQVSATSYESRVGNGIAVPATTVDRLVADGRRAPDVVKIDVEGAELEVLEGMSVTVARHRPVLVIELHVWANTVATLAILESWHYALEAPSGAALDGDAILRALATTESVRIVARPGDRAP